LERIYFFRQPRESHGSAGGPYRWLRIAVLGALLLAGGPASADRPEVAGPADPHYERGAHLLRQGDIDAAVAELARAAELAPDEPRVLALYAQALLVSGDAAASLSVLERLRAVDPTAPGLEYFLGLASYRQGDWAATREHLKESLEGSPDAALNHLFLAVAHQELGELDLADAELEKAVAADPTLAGQVAYRRGIIAIARRDPDAAKAHFEVAEATLPGSPLARSAATYATRLDALFEKPWEVHASAGLGYDSNLNLANDSDPFVSSGLQAGRGIAEVGGSYAFGDRDASLRIGQTLYSHFYTDHGIFDQLVNRTWAQARKQISSAISADLRYTFEFAWADWSQFRQTHAVEPGLSFQISNEMFVRAFFRYESREFFIPVTLAAFDRDGEINRGGADLFYSLPADWLWGSSWVRAGYRFREENSDGSQFRSGGHVPVLTISLALPARLILNLDGRIEWRKYDVASLVDPSVGIREDHIGRLRTAVLRPLTDHLTLELSHVWTDRTSNVNSFDYQRHELSLLATYQY